MHVYIRCQGNASFNNYITISERCHTHHFPIMKCVFFSTGKPLLISRSASIKRNRLHLRILQWDGYMTNPVVWLSVIFIHQSVASHYSATSKCFTKCEYDTNWEPVLRTNHIIERWCVVHLVSAFVYWYFIEETHEEINY